MDNTSGGIPEAAIEQRLRKELSSWLEVCFGNSCFSRRLLETASRWCSDEGVRKLSEIRDVDAVSEFAEALSLDPADPRLLELPSKLKIKSRPPAVTCHQCAQADNMRRGMSEGSVLCPMLCSDTWFRVCEFVGVSKHRLCDECLKEWRLWHHCRRSGLKEIRD